MVGHAEVKTMNAPEVKGTFQVPDQFATLPVTKKLDRIDPEKNFILVAHTGSGKTMVVPIYLIFKTGRKILMRQPTRVATRSAYEGLKEFWGPLGYKIGMLTSEDTVGTVDDNDLTVVTDGEMTHILKNPKYKFTCIFDEIHSQMAATEIELAIVKTYMNKGMDIRVVLLSATIRPENILNHFETLNTRPQTREYISFICDELEKGEGVNNIDQKQYLKVYYTEGVAYPVQKKIIHPATTNARPEMDFARRMAKEKKRGLIFVCTRNQVSEIASVINDDPLLQPILPALEAHADIDARTIKKFVDEHEPCIVVATVALATSITMPFDEELTMDQGIDSKYEDGIVKTVTNIPLDDNGVLQRAGRVGRVKPGVAILCSAHEKEEILGDGRIRKVPLRQSWNDIRPTLIVPPLEKLPPDTMVLTCASYGIDVRDLDTMSRKDPQEIEASINRLTRWGLIEKNGYLKITRKGRRVFNLPLDIRMGVLLVDCPEPILPAIIAITAMGDGSYHMFKPSVPDRDEVTGQMIRRRGYEFLGDDMKDPDSVLMVKIKILQQFFRLRMEGDGLANAWADDNGLLTRKMDRAAYQWYNIIKKGLGRGESGLRNKFIHMDLSQDRTEILAYLNRTRVFERNVLEYNSDKDYYHGTWMGRWTVMSNDQSILMGKKYWGFGIEVLGHPRVMLKKDGKGEFCFWDDVTVVRILNEWEDFDAAMQEVDE